MSTADGTPARTAVSTSTSGRVPGPAAATSGVTAPRRARRAGLSADDVRARAADAGVVLPPPPDPVGAYHAGVVHAGVGYVSGQFPLADGRLRFPGRVGAELTAAEGYEAARLAAQNVLAQLARLLGPAGRLVTLLRVDGVVASAPSFLAQPAVLDGASELFRRVLGDAGGHARSAIAVERLPLDAAVELVVTFAVETDVDRHDPDT